MREGSRLLFSAGALTFQVESLASWSGILSGMLEGFPARDSGRPQMRISLLSPSDTDDPISLFRGRGTDLARLVGWRSDCVSVAIRQVDRHAMSSAMAYGLVLAHLFRRGLLVHSACGIYQGEAFLFVGPSGAGKSTVLSHALELEPVHDDRVGLRMVGEEVEAFNAPQLDNSGRTGRHRAARVGGVFLLAKDRRNWVEKVPIVEAIQELCRQVLVPVELAELRWRAVDTLLAILSRGLVRRLHFRREANVTDLIRDSSNA